MIGGVIGRDIASLDYDARLEALLLARVGLWDTVASAQRKGSLDGALRAVEHNPLGNLVAKLPALNAIGFNGATAAKIGRRALGQTPFALVDLPSSSPAHARMSFAQKAEQWKYLRDFLA